MKKYYEIFSRGYKKFKKMLRNLIVKIFNILCFFLIIAILFTIRKLMLVILFASILFLMIAMYVDYCLDEDDDY